MLSLNIFRLAHQDINKIGSSLNSRHYAECWVHLRDLAPWQHSSEETSQRWRAFHNTRQPRWPSGKSVRLGSCRFGFDSESGQTNDFKIVIHSFPA